MEDFVRSLDQWVNSQKNLLDFVNKLLNEDPSKLDRTDLILESRMSFHHIIRTLDAFDRWLQEPSVLRYMPQDLLLDVRNTILKVLAQVLELDIRHTSSFKQTLLELYKEGKIEPIFFGFNVTHNQQQRERRGII